MSSAPKLLFGALVAILPIARRNPSLTTRSVSLRGWSTRRIDWPFAPRPSPLAPRPSPLATRHSPLAQACQPAEPGPGRCPRREGPGKRYDAGSRRDLMERRPMLAMADNDVGGAVAVAVLLAG